MASYHRLVTELDTGGPVCPPLAGDGGPLESEFWILTRYINYLEDSSKCGIQK